MLKKIYILLFALLCFACPPPESDLSVKVIAPETNVGVDGYSVYANDVEIKWEVEGGSGKYEAEIEINGETKELQESSIKFTEEGKYIIDAYVFDKKANAMGTFSLQLMIDKTAPDLSKISYKNRVHHSEYADFEDTPNDDNQLTDNLSGVDFSTLKFSWKEPLAEGVQSATLERLVTVSDFAGNEAVGSYEVKVFDVYLPTEIVFNGSKTIYTETQLEVTVYPENANDKSVTYSCQENDFFTLTTEGVLTPKAKGTAGITITAVADPEVSITVPITIDVVDLDFGDIHLTKVKSYDFKGTTLPFGWTNTGAKETITESGLISKGDAAEINLKIPVQKIGEFDYIQIKYKRTASETYKPDIFICNDANRTNGTKLFYQNTVLGFANKWTPTVSQEIDYKGGDDFILWGGMKISDTEALVSYDNVFHKLNYNNTTDTWYNNGVGNLEVGITHKTQDENVTTTIENISFFKKKVIVK